MPFPTWLAGQRITAEALTEMQPLRADKTVSQSVTSSTTFQSDPEMFLVLPSAGTYRFEAHCLMAANTDNAADVKFTWTFSSGNLNWAGLGVGITITTATIFASEWLARTDSVSGSTSISYGLSPASTTHVLLKGTFRANSAQTLQLQWAQVASSVQATTMIDGSYMTAWRVA